MEGMHCNAQMEAQKVQEICVISDVSQNVVEQSHAATCNLSALAPTIAF
jgi:hypothetical protein